MSLEEKRNTVRIKYSLKKILFLQKKDKTKKLLQKCACKQIQYSVRGKTLHTDKAGLGG